MEKTNYCNDCEKIAHICDIRKDEKLQKNCKFYKESKQHYHCMFLRFEKFCDNQNAHEEKSKKK